MLTDLRLFHERRIPECLPRAAAAALAVEGIVARIGLDPSWDPPHNRVLVEALVAEARRRGYQPVRVAGTRSRATVLPGDDTTVAEWTDEAVLARPVDAGTFPTESLVLTVPGGVAFWGIEEAETLDVAAWGPGAEVLTLDLFDLIWSQLRATGGTTG